MAGVGKPKLRPSLISFIGQILKIRFGDVKNLSFQILKGYSRDIKSGTGSGSYMIWYSVKLLSCGRR
jgi:hypothetical protein